MIHVDTAPPQRQDLVMPRQLKCRGVMCRALAGLALGVMGCGDEKPDSPPIYLTPSQLVGTWSAPIDPGCAPCTVSACHFEATFAADGTVGSGVVCLVPASTDVDVEWTTGTYTAAPDGRINFLGAGPTCPGAYVNYYAMYSSSPHPTVSAVLGADVLDLSLSSSSLATSARAVRGCFSADWSFTPLTP